MKIQTLSLGHLSQSDGFAIKTQKYSAAFWQSHHFVSEFWQSAKGTASPPSLRDLRALRLYSFKSMFLEMPTKNLSKGIIMGFFGGKKIFDATEKNQDAHSFGINGKTIICPHCGNNRFEKGFAMLNTAWLTFFSLDWANKQAAILTCTTCTHIQWFLKEPEVTG